MINLIFQNVLLNIFETVIENMMELWFWLVIGFILSGIIQEFVPAQVFTKYMGKGGRSIVSSAGLGVAVDVCSCGILPVAISFHKKGASHGSILSFLNATPWLGISILILLYKFFGITIATLFIIGSVIVAIFSGYVVDLFNTERKCVICNENGDFCEYDIDDHDVGHDHDHDVDHHHLCEDDVCEPCSAIEFKISQDQKSDKEPLSKRFKRVFYYSWDLTKDIMPWILFGVVLGAIIEVLIPVQYVSTWLGGDNYVLAMLLALLLSIPVFICTAGAIPLTYTLLNMGASSGAVFVMLTAGVATNVASYGTIKKSMGKQTAIINLGAVCTMSVIVGIVIHLLMISALIPII